MAKYRKKPVVIEAVKLEDDYTSIYNAVEFVFSIGMETSIIGANATFKQVRENGGIDVPAPEGTVKAIFGEYIIKTITGEFYPCKPDFFESEYEKFE